MTIVSLCFNTKYNISPFTIHKINLQCIYFGNVALFYKLWWCMLQFHAIDKIYLKKTIKFIRQQLENNWLFYLLIFLFVSLDLKIGRCIVWMNISSTLTKWQIFIPNDEEIGKQIRRRKQRLDFVIILFIVVLLLYYFEFSNSWELF